MKVQEIKTLIPLGQHVLVERDKDVTEWMTSKSGILTPQGVVEDEGLVFGTVISAPKDQNLLIDKDRSINEIEIKKGMKVWYSKYSTKRVMDWQKKDGSMLDVIPLEDLMAVVTV